MYINDPTNVTGAITAAKYRGDNTAWDMARRITSAMLAVMDADKAAHDSNTWNRASRSWRPASPAEIADRQKALDMALAAQAALLVEARTLCDQYGWVAPVLPPPTPFTGDDEDSSYCGHTD